jgi:hypothetical protein
MCVTTFSDAGYEKYGKRMIDTFDEFWAPGIELMVFCDTPTNHPSDRVLDFPLENFPKIQEFTDRHKDNPVAHGKQETNFWVEKERNQGYSFRFDAVRFHYSAMVPYYAAQFLVEQYEKGILIFMDGDVIAKEPISHNWIETKILRRGKRIAYLGREGSKSTETGFVAYRLPKAMRFLKRYHDVYVTDEIFKMGPTANAYVFDHVLSLDVISRRYNLTPGTSRSHVWLESPLAEKLTHLKGATNKDAGKMIIT